MLFCVVGVRVVIVVVGLEELNLGFKVSCLNFINFADQPLCAFLSEKIACKFFKTHRVYYPILLTCRVFILTFN